jgi:hypothetical protein
MCKAVSPASVVERPSSKGQIAIQWIWMGLWQGTTSQNIWQGYPLVNCHITMERSTHLWVNQVFRLGHVQVRFLFVYQAGYIPFIIH